MRDLRLLDQYRKRSPDIIKTFGWAGDGTCGVFQLPLAGVSGHFTVVASAGEGWDHVSISRPDRCPTWDEMDRLKRLFFADNETAWQYHLKPVDHINVHPFTLHIWRKQGFDMPLPPREFV